MTRAGRVVRRRSAGDSPPSTGSTISPSPTSSIALDLALRRALEREAPGEGERWLVAFSGGPDSTALAAALAPLAAARGLVLTLAHVDHGGDPDSPRRAKRAAELAARLGLDLVLAMVDVPRWRRRRESPEAAARRLRYAELERLRRETGATRILTAHHRDDQVETLLLKLLRGAALERLGGIAERRGRLLRPLLGVPRDATEARLARDEIEPVRDPTNEDMTLPRNRLRRLLLPRLRTAEPGLDDALLALARRAEALRVRLGTMFDLHFQAKATARASIEGEGSSGPKAATRASESGNSSVGRSRRGRQDRTEPDPLPLPSGDERPGLAREPLTRLPEPLQLPALRWLLAERLNVGQLPSLPSMEAFLSLVSRGKDAALRLPGEPRALVARRGRLSLAVPESRTPPFTYTFSIPGEVELPELGLRLRIRRSPVEPWMLRGERTRAGFRADTVRATVRSRRSGDRLRPLGAPGSRKLKQVLIDRGVPADARDRLPLVEIAGELAWVPGVTIGDGFALAGEAECWLAELEPLADGPGGGERKTTT